MAPYFFHLLTTRELPDESVLAKRPLELNKRGLVEVLKADEAVNEVPRLLDKLSSEVDDLCSHVDVLSRGLTTVEQSLARLNFAAAGLQERLDHLDTSLGQLEGRAELIATLRPKRIGKDADLHHAPRPR